MKVFTGKVISKKMQKTATVAVKRVVAHPVYKKRIRMVKKYHVHDEIGVDVGQVVKFVASKPYSKLKKWKIIEVAGLNKKAKAGIQIKKKDKDKNSEKTETKKAKVTKKKQKTTKPKKKKGSKR